MLIHAVFVSDAPGVGERIPSLPARPARHTVYLLPSGYALPKRLYPVLWYDPLRAKERPDRYYDPDTLNLSQLLLAWHVYLRKRCRRKHWRAVLLQRAPSIYYLAFDRKGRVIDYNQAIKVAARLLGRPPLKVGASILDLAFPENRADIEKELQIVFEGQAIQLQRAIGSRHAEVHFIPLSREGSVFGYYALDITVYRRLLEASIVQQNLYESILQYLRDGVILLDPNQKILYLNPSAELILGKDIYTLLGTPFTIEPLGEVFIYRGRPIIATSVLLEDGRTLFILRDLSELWEVEKKHTLLQKAIAQAPLGILITTTEVEKWEPIYFNQTFEQWFPQSECDISSVFQKYLSNKEKKQLLKRLREQQPFQILLRNKSKTHPWTHLLGTFFPIELSLPGASSELYWAVILQDQSQIYQAIRRQRSLEQRQQQLILEAQEKERKLLAEELHDNLGMLLSALKMELSTILQDIPTSSPLQMRLSALSTRLDEVVQAVRLTSHQLMPPLVEHFGLIPSLQGLLRRFRATSSLQIHLEVTGEEVSLPLIKMLQIYRILQELITNTLRHAHAENLYINLHYQKRRLIIHVWDDGRGYDPAAIQREGIGLRNIRGRLQILRAKWENLSAPEKGAHYRIEIPLPRKKS